MYSIFHWLVILVIVLLFFFGRNFPDIFRHIGNGPRGPNHPLPVTSPVETKRPNNPEKKENWHAVKFLRRKK